MLFLLSNNRIAQCSAAQCSAAHRSAVGEWLMFHLNSPSSYRELSIHSEVITHIYVTYYGISLAITVNIIVLIG